MSSDLQLSHPARGRSGSALDLLVAYARAHRDRRNIQMHLVGVPLAVLSMGLLMRGPQGVAAVGGVTPAWALFGLVSVWYLTRGHLRLGLAASALVGILFYAAHQLPLAGVLAWLGTVVLLAGLSSLLQLAGHYYEGRRPASWSHPVHLLVGPMFVSAVMLGGVGLLRGVRAEVMRRAGPVHVRDLAHPQPTP
jgi:uncharacterized membrane protein YGL010W